MNKATKAEILANKFPIDPPEDSPLRLKPYCRTTTKGIPFQIYIPPNGARPEAKVQANSYEIVCKRAIEALIRLENLYGGNVEMTSDDMREANKAKAKLAAAGFRSDQDFEDALAMGVLVYIADKKYRAACERKKITCTKSIAQLGQEEADRLLVTIQEAVEDLLKKIPEPEDPPTRSDGKQVDSMGYRLSDLVEFVGGPDISFVDCIRDDNKLAAWLSSRIASKDSDWALSTRVKGLQDAKRLIKHICPPRGFPMPSGEVFPRTPKGDKPPVIAIEPEIVERLLHLVLKKNPRRLMHIILQAKFGLRPDEAWKILPVLRKYLGKDFLTVPADISKNGEQRIIWIRPDARAWMEKVPGWLDGSVTNFLEERYRDIDGVEKIQRSVKRYLKQAGWKKVMPKEALRKSWITACVKMGVPIRDLAQEDGHSEEVLIQTYLDPTWTEEMGRTYFSQFPDSKPTRSFTDYELCHAFTQSKP